MNIEDLPKGALPDPLDIRDYQVDMSMGSALVDWSKEYRLPNPGDEDQGQSSSCVAQAWSYYHIQLRPKDFSRRDIYSQIYLPQGGAYIRDGGLRIVKFGQATRDEVPDPKPQTETNMRDKTGVTLEKEASDTERDSFLITDGTIDGIAAAIEQYKGVVFGVQGTNAGWKNLQVPEPPTSPTEPGIWGHALYAMGHHMHTNPDGTKEKCIIAKSSWCNSVSEHHIRERYFKAGMTFNAWTLIPRETISIPMYKKAVHLDGKTFAALIITPNGSQTIDATSEEVWRSFSIADSYQLNTVNPDGTTNFSTADCIHLPW